MRDAIHLVLAQAVKSLVIMIYLENRGCASKFGGGRTFGSDDCSPSQKVGAKAIGFFTAFPRSMPSRGRQVDGKSEANRENTCEPS